MQDLQKHWSRSIEGLQCVPFSILSSLRVLWYLKSNARGSYMTYGWTGMCRPDFVNLPTYNIHLWKNRPYFMSKNERDMKIIRLSRPYYCLQLYYENLWRAFTTFLTEKGKFSSFLQFVTHFYGVFAKIIPMFREFQFPNYTKSPPAPRDPMHQFFLYRSFNI